MTTTKNILAPAAIAVAMGIAAAGDAAATGKGGHQPQPQPQPQQPAGLNNTIGIQNNPANYNNIGIQNTVSPHINNQSSAAANATNKTNVDVNAAGGAGGNGYGGAGGTAFGGAATSTAHGGAANASANPIANGGSSTATANPIANGGAATATGGSVSGSGNSTSTSSTGPISNVNSTGPSSSSASNGNQTMSNYSNYKAAAYAPPVFAQSSGPCGWSIGGSFGNVATALGVGGSSQLEWCHGQYVGIEVMKFGAQVGDKTLAISGAATITESNSYAKAGFRHAVAAARECGPRFIERASIAEGVVAGMEISEGRRADCSAIGGRFGAAAAYGEIRQRRHRNKVAKASFRGQQVQIRVPAEVSARTPVCEGDKPVCRPVKATRAPVLTK